MSNTLEEILYDYLRVPFIKRRQTKRLFVNEIKSMEVALEAAQGLASEGKYCKSSTNFKDLESVVRFRELNELLDILSFYIREGTYTIDRIINEIYSSQDSSHSTKIKDILPKKIPVTVADLKNQVDTFIQELAPNIGSEYLMLARLYSIKYLLYYFFGVQLIGRYLVKDWSEESISKDLQEIALLWKDELNLEDDIIVIDTVYNIMIHKKDDNECITISSESEEVMSFERIQEIIKSISNLTINKENIS